MKDKLSKLMEKDGFYIILFICVCVVAITAVATSRDNLNKPKEDNLSESEDFIIIDEDELEPSLESSRMEDASVIKDDEPEEIENEELEEIEKVEEESDDTEDMEEDTEDTDIEFVTEEEATVTTPSKVVQDMILPVNGEIGTDFTTDKLVYSETLEQWTGHKGIDIFADEGTNVVAALSGTITEVYKDDLWGIVILIEHGDGLMTKYANLSTENMVVEGTKVNAGDVINKVGKSASIEMMMNPHVHFEVIKDGINIDPKNHIPVLNN